MGRRRGRSRHPVFPFKAKIPGEGDPGCPPGSISVAAGDLTQSVLNAGGAGATFCLGNGVHRLTGALTPLTNQTIVAATRREAIISGSTVYTSGAFTPSGGQWFIGGMTQQGSRYANAYGQGTENGCPEQVFFDDVPLNLKLNNEIQTLDFGDIGAGDTFKLTYSGVTTPTATTYSADMSTAILDNLGAGNTSPSPRVFDYRDVTVTKVSTSVYRVAWTFSNSEANTDASMMSITSPVGFTPVGVSEYVKGGTKPTLAAGQFWFDYPNDTIWLYDNPAVPNKIEIGNGATNAFSSSNTGVTLRGLVFEKFNAAALGATVHVGTNWTVDDCEIRFSFGSGVRMGSEGQSGGVLKNSRVHDNRYAGMFGGGADYLMDTVEVDRNAWGGFNTNWESSGSKFVDTLRLTLLNCHFHDNRGAGFWTDINNIYTVIDGGIYEDNGNTGVIYGVSAWTSAGFGIVAEIGYDIEVKNTLVRNNNGPGILSSNNRAMTIHDNVTYNNGPGSGGSGTGEVFAWSTNRGTSGSSPTGNAASRAIYAKYGADAGWETRDFYAYNNTIGLANPSTARVCGIESVGSDANESNTRSSAWANRWHANDYQFADTLARYEWADAMLTGQTWRDEAGPTWEAFDTIAEGSSWTP